MQVVCDKCGARYEFEAADIPAEGYDAQCTSCGHIFFVSPEGDNAPSRAIEQLTPAQAVFETAATELNGEPDTPPAEQEPSEPSPAAQDEYPDFDDAASTDMESAPTGDLEEPPEPDEDDEIEEQEAIAAVDSFDDMMALSAQLGEPTRERVEIAPIDDMELSSRRRSSFARTVVLSVLGAAFYAGGTYLVLPQVFDKTIGQFIGVDAGVDPAAVPYCEKGQDLLLGDTPKAIKNALGQFSKAESIDDNYGDAQAFRAVTNTFLGADLKGEGTNVLDLKQAAEAELERLDGLTGKDRPEDFMERVQRLRAQATSGQKAQEFVERGGRALMKARRAIESGLELHANNPNFKLAAAIHKLQDPDTVGAAERYLRDYLSGMGLGVADLESPPNHWIGYVHGAILMGHDSTLKEAPAAFEAAISLEPRFQRARLRLAEAYHQLGQVDKAIAVLTSIVKAQPKHVRGNRLLKAWSPAKKTNVVPSGEVAGSKADKPAKLKKGASKKKVKKRGKKGKKAKKGKKGKKTKKGKKGKKAKQKTN